MSWEGNMTRGFSALFISILLLGLSASAHAFVWFWSSKESRKEDRIQPRALQIQAVDSPGQADPIVRIAADRNVFVICSDCPAVSPLVRDMQDVNITIRMSPKRQPVTEAGSASQGVPGPASQSAASRIPSLSPETLISTPMPVMSSPIERSVQKRASCLDPPIYFEFNSAEVAQAERERLREVIPVLQAGREVEVFGYTCEIGSKEYNDGLAMRRANAVTKILEEMGVAGIRVKAEGKCCYVSDDKTKNRRVEIKCVKGTQKGE